MTFSVESVFSWTLAMAEDKVSAIFNCSSASSALAGNISVITGGEVVVDEAARDEEKHVLDLEYDRNLTPCLLRDTTSGLCLVFCFFLCTSRLLILSDIPVYVQSFLFSMIFHTDFKFGGLLFASAVLT